jgi:hypothetical protein
MNSPEEPRNPFAPPEAEIVTSSDDSGEMEADRQFHIAREKSLKTIGWIDILSGALGLLSFLFLLLTGQRALLPQAGWEIALGLISSLLALGVGWALLKLRKEAQLGMLVQFVLTLPSLRNPEAVMIPSFAINLLFLYLVFSPKGQRVLEPDYKEVIRQTPHVRYKTALWLWIVLFLLLAFLAIMLLPLFLR